MKKARPKSWWIPWAFVGFFVVVVAVNAGMVTAAFRTWTGIDTPDHYQRGLAYNKAIAAQEAQEKRGWRAAVSFEPTAERKGRFNVAMTDKAGEGLIALKVRVLFKRPTNTQDDFKADLAHLGGGRYGAEVAFPLKGNWRAEVIASRGGDQHRATEDLEIK